jgi:nucleoside phosphorylase
MRAAWLAGVIVVIATVGAAQAQSLGDVARRESERRATITTTDKVYTNASLPAPIVAAAPAPAPAPEPPPVDTLETMPAVKVSDFDDRNEAYWRQLAEQLRVRMVRVMEDEAGLDARQRSLAAGLSATQVEERKVTLALLQTTQADRRALDMEWLALEKQAKNAGIPLAWLR